MRSLPSAALLLVTGCIVEGAAAEPPAPGPETSGAEAPPQAVVCTVESYDDDDGSWLLVGRREIELGPDGELVRLTTLREEGQVVHEVFTATPRGIDIAEAPGEGALWREVREVSGDTVTARVYALSDGELVEPSSITRYRYGSDGRILEVSYLGLYDESLENGVLCEYDARGRLARIADYEGSHDVVTADLRLSFDAEGRLARIAGTSGSVELRTEVSYTERGAELAYHSSDIAPLDEPPSSLTLISPAACIGEYYRPCDPRTAPPPPSGPRHVLP